MPCERHKAMLRKYAERMKTAEEVNCAIDQNRKVYDTNDETAK